MIAALEVLASDPPLLAAGEDDPRWPDLTNAVHWLVDDTWWDHRDPIGSVGLILENELEAGRARDLVELVVSVADRQGPSSPDAAWFGDALWSDVRKAAAAMLALMVASPG